MGRGGACPCPAHRGHVLRAEIQQPENNRIPQGTEATPRCCRRPCDYPSLALKVPAVHGWLPRSVSLAIISDPSFQNPSQPPVLRFPFNLCFIRPRYCLRRSVLTPRTLDSFVLLGRSKTLQRPELSERVPVGSLPASAPPVPPLAYTPSIPPRVSRLYHACQVLPSRERRVRQISRSRLIRRTSGVSSPKREDGKGHNKRKQPPRQDNQETHLVHTIHNP
ncbi:hypothetical protein N658DRAFT_187025 [Parathielavia hyrcaniae]|uniref:Uncharacterized protein n=1 Tax=Parathielavia hyrcaniae TaxID=113614 RepID=A0AAN6QCI0_9PEZI|nr:hypothetical protein N658DRAFT_187025 [Parathielavia hyrcaniae]